MEYTEQLILKWLAEDISVEELKTLEESVDLASLAKTLKAAKGLELSVTGQEEMWKQFESKRNLKTSDLANIPVDTIPSAKSYFRWIWLLLAAIAIGLITFLFFPTQQKKKIETAPQQEEEILMADNTIIKLSPASYISWDDRTWEENRILDLDGQAFFNVRQKGAFLVNTSLGAVSVKGTSFDIWEIDNDRLRVQCYTGVVEVTNTKKKTLALNQGEEIYMFNDVFGKVSKITNTQPDWFSGGLDFQNVPFSSIFKDMNRFYGLTVTSVDIDDSVGFTGYLPMNDLNNALEIIQAVSGWQYERPNNSSLVFKK